MTMHHRRLRPGAAAVAAFLAATALVQAAPAGAATPKSAVPATRTAKSGTAKPAPMGHTSKSVANQPAADPDANDPTAVALRQAASTGKPVTITSLTNTGTLVQANPNGTLTRTLTSMPQRVQQNGTWVPIDTTLSLKNGVLTPKAAATGVTFSAGGNTTMATLGTGTDSLGFTWPSALPTPVITGSTATYPNVFPDVDLQLTADPSGYSSVLVLKTPAAANDPQLQNLSLGTSTKHITLSTTSDGGTQAVDPTTKQVVFHSDTALMWDSTNTSANTGTHQTATATPSASTPKTAVRAATASPTAVAESELASAQRVGAHQAKIGVSLKDGRQFLSLNKSLLTAKTTHYPVFVDPEWSGNPSQLDWARISDNGDNVYNSTAKSGDANAREGWDDNDPGNGERARTYYQMSTGFIDGATVTSATLSVVQLSAASCSATPATVFGTTYPGGWNSSGLYWGHEPTVQTGELGTPPTSEEAGVCPVNNGTGSYVSPPDLSFNVTSRAQSAAKGNWSGMTLMVESVNMNDATQWKELGYGGGASLSITYSFPPQLTSGTGVPKITPIASDFGQNVTWTSTPTLSATAYEHSGDPDLLRMDYHVYNSAGTQVEVGLNSSYTAHGLPYTVPTLPDGTYTWKATAENASGLWAGTGAGIWTPTQTFTINTTAPKPPTVSSTQFPANEIGAAFGSAGTFVLDNDRSNTVVGYMFALNSNLSNTSYTTSVPKLTSTTTIASGTTYFASADNANGTGTAVNNGIAALSIKVPNNGPNTLYVKAVNNAGTTSAEESYLFYAGTSTPTYAYGDKMVTGYTATNTDSTTTTVPAATATSAGGHLISQGKITGVTWGDGAQGMLANVSSTSKVANGDSATLSFDIPATGVWDIGANLTQATDYGTYNLVLDSAGANPVMLMSGFDAYSPFVTTKFEDFGVPESSTNAPLTLSEGVHTLTLMLTGQDPSSAGFQAGIDLLRLAPVPTCSINNTTSCLNNTAFSTYTPAAGSTPAKVTTANADGNGYSFNEPDLASTGWPTNGGSLTVDGASITLPKLSSGLSDNMLASGQTLTVPSSGVVNTGDALVFLAFATDGDADQATGSVTYQASKSCSSSQSYTVDTVPDWATGPSAAAALMLPHRNTASATQSSQVLKVYIISVPLACPGTPITSIGLPVMSNGVQGGISAMHILGVGIRPSSSTWDSGGNTLSHLTGTWEAVNDTGVLTNVAGTASASLSGQTLRIPVYVTIGTDSNNLVRIHLSNARGSGPVTFNAASIALQDPVALKANTTGGVVPLTFNGGSTSITLPVGTDALSDPVTLAVAPQSTVLVSLDVNGATSQLSGHSDSQAPIYVSTADGTDHTMDPTAASYSIGDIGGIPYLSGVDVSTPTSVGALVLYGDQSVNSDTVSGDGQHHLNDEIANAMVANPDGDGQVDYGVLNGGTNSWTSSNNLLPGGSAANPLNTDGRPDRAILEQANVRTVLISTGTSDLLACPTTDTAATCATGVEAKLQQLASGIGSYYNDDSLNPAGGGSNDYVTVYIATIPPGATPLTGVPEQARELVNTFLLSQTSTSATCTANGPGSNIGADGIIDFAGAVSTDGSATDAAGSTVKTGDLDNSRPDDQYYTDLANAYITDSSNPCMVSPGPN